MSIHRILAVTDPDVAQFPRDLLISHWALADVCKHLPKHHDKIQGHLVEALAIGRKLVAEGRLAPKDEGLIEKLELCLASARRGSEPS